MADLADYSHPKPVRQLLESLARVICPSRAQELELIDDIVDHVELSMRASPAGVRAALLTGFSGYELAAMVYPSHFGKRASYEQPAMMADIGYTPQEWIDKSIRYRLQTYDAAIAKRAVDILAPDPLPGVIGPERS